VTDRPRPDDHRRPKPASSGKGGGPGGHGGQRGHQKPGGKPGHKPAGKAGRAGPPWRPGPAGPGGPVDGPQEVPPLGPRHASRPPDRRIPEGPGREVGPHHRATGDRGPWRPPRPEPGPGGPRRGPYRGPTHGDAGGHEPRGPERGPGGPQRSERRPSGPYTGRPRPYAPGAGQRPPFRGGPPGERGPWRPPPPPDRPGPRPWARPAFGATPWPRPEAALPPPDLLGPDEELVAGRRPVEEAFAAGRAAYRLLVVPQRRNALEQLVLHATRLRIPIVEVEGGSLTAIAGFDGHQGVALVVEPRAFATLEDVLARAEERGEPPFVLVLDSLEDPQNVGTLLRSAEAAGVHGVVFPTRRQAPLSPAAVKASAGAVEHLLLCPVDDLAAAVTDLHGHGLRIAGSDADAPLTARQSDLRGPLAIVVGSEGQGLGPAIRRRCDLFMRIPMRGAIGSLNAAVAGSVLLFEAVAQRDPDGRPPAVVVTAKEVRRTPETSLDAGPADARIEAPAAPKRRSRSGATDTPRPPDTADAATAPETPDRPAPPELDGDLVPGGPASPATSNPRKPRTPRTPHA
jgi:23S rRNA (guanosine2251-2'-O)-methyltransferase